MKTIIVEKLPDNKLIFLRQLREIADLSLKDAKELMTYIEENIPCPIITGIDEEKCNYTVKNLSDISCVVKVEETTIKHPMLIFPRAKFNYEMNMFGIKKI